MVYKLIENGTYVGERALFSTHHTIIEGSIFKDGESPLKESGDLRLSKVSFEWKYPLWYCNDVIVEDTTFKDTARSGVWYTKHISLNNCVIDAPKTFRRSEDITIVDSKINNAQETLWNCKNIKLKNVYVKGDYLGFNSSDIEIDNLYLDGNYAFDGARNIKITNSVLHSKDSFWNCENVVVKDSKIVGEYLSWNTKNITFINCEIESHQGLCYMDNVTLINCTLKNTDLCFEFCSNINAEINSEVDSIKNPISGTIKVKSVKELILEDKFIDKSKTKIIIEEK